MDNYSGIIYRIYAFAGPTLLLGLVLVFLALKEPLSKRKATMRIAILVLIVSIWQGSFYTYKSQNPTVLCHEGYLVEVYRARRAPFTDAYVFSNSDGLKPTFYLDFFSDEDVFGGELLENVKYQVFYEKDTKIIVRVMQVD